MTKSERPSPSLQEILASDSIPPAQHMREPSEVDMGNADISIDRYISKDFHDREIDKIWRKTWQWACRLEDIPNTGDHVVYEIVNDSLIVVRTGPKPTDIRAYINACLHRGTQLRTESGCVKQFKCPFHGFTWGLDGCLKHVPEQWDFKHINFADFSLPEAKVDIWAGFVFINFDVGCEPLLDYLEILPEHFKAFALEDRYKAIHVAKIMPCNWKLCAEAFVEAYHVASAHPQTIAYYGDVNTQYDVWPDVKHINRMISAQGVSSPSKPNLEDAMIRTQMERDTPFFKSPQPFSDDTSARAHFAEVARAKISGASGRDFSHVSDSEAIDLIQYTVFPNFIPYGGLGLSAGYRFRPFGDDPRRSIMEIFFLFPKYADGSHPRPPPITWLAEDEPWSSVAAMGSAAMVVDQDTDNLKRIQRGLLTTRKPGVTLASYQESRIRHFHQTLDTYMAKGSPS